MAGLIPGTDEWNAKYGDNSNAWYNTEFKKYWNGINPAIN